MARGRAAGRDVGLTERHLSGWGVETVEGGVVRSAGADGAPALWFVHALGDSSGAFLPLLSSRLSSAFELLLFKALLTFQSPRIVCRHLLNNYPDLAERTGFKFFPEMF